MPRPKKEKPNHGDLYEIKITLGKTLDGKLIRKSFYSSISKADAKKQAEEWKIAQRVADITGEALIEKNFTFEQWAEKWLKTIRGTVKDNTYNLTYTNSVRNHLIPQFGKLDMGSIRLIDLQSFFSQSTASMETQKKWKLCLSGIFESAVENGVASKNPCAKIKLSGESARPKRIYTEQQAELVMDYAKGHRFGIEILLMLTYGLRRGELLGIMWEDIDFQNKILHIKRAVADVKNAQTGELEVIIDSPKTKFSIRDLPLSDDLTRQLENMQRVSDYVVHTRFGDVCSPRTWSRRHYDVFMKEMHQFYLSKDPPIDVPILNSHELRHTRASLWVNGGKNLFAVADAMGWGDLKMLRRRYAHSDIEATRKALSL